MIKPEILAPAGDMEKLKTAFRYGADACYMGVKSMSMRVKIDDKGGDALEEALKLKNKLNKKIYLTMNIHAHENKLAFLDKELERLTKLHKKGLDPDGILVSDVGILNLIREQCPWLPIHVSTQANTLNSSAIEFWEKQGAERVVLGREVSLHELRQIRDKLSKKGIDVEIEGFVHGAMCMAYSGRCLLSNFMANRDANEGMCAHSCRWKYKVYLEEELRPGEFVPMEEDPQGTSLMSSKDMCMIEHLGDLIDAQLDSLKLEGRHKTVYYTAIVTRAYREALDLAMEGKSPTPEILDLIDSINTRGYFTGFWYGRPGAEGQLYNKCSNANEQYCFAGIIRKADKKTVTMEVRNRLDKGDRLDIITPDKTIPVILDEFRDAETGEQIGHASGGQGFSITFDVPEGLEEGFVVRKHLQSSRTKVKIKTEKIRKLTNH
ncbi:U32 family peptidase [Candidatus Peregrinibacteria bacterium]|nr:U32 family peptidase [Candidatus Peregrinibacteria bacterium]